MTTVAAGLALKGFLPITYTIATFNVYKTVEQIKVDVCYPNLGVIIVGVGDEDFSAMEALDSDHGNLQRGIVICLGAAGSMVKVH